MVTVASPVFGSLPPMTAEPDGAKKPQLCFPAVDVAPVPTVTCTYGAVEFRIHSCHPDSPTLASATLSPRKHKCTHNM